MTAATDCLPRPPGSARLLQGPLAAFTTDRQISWVAGTDPATDGGGGEAATADEAVAGDEVVAAYRLLQDAADYRGTLRRWFTRVRPGGHLIVVVPHAFLYERQTALPSRWHAHQQRLYTPAALLAEVEEALVPNSYRVRWLGDLDGGYDYDQPVAIEPTGDSDVGLVIERIAAPGWGLDADLPRRGRVVADAPPFAFEPPHTRMEVARRGGIERLLLMKLDHLGDFIMAVPALERARRYFPDASIDLMVGSWNVDLASDLGLADRVIGFDAFPRNSSEVEPHVDAMLGLFREQATQRYDLAVDLRADVDTRALLRVVRAPLKAGIGTRARFPFLDIALPLDDTRNEATRPLDEHVAPDRFIIQGAGTRRHFGLYSNRDTVEREHPIVWGPYLELDPGDYMFDFYIDLQQEHGSGVLHLDVALDRGRRVAEMIVSGPGSYQLHFRVDRPRTTFEARIATVEGAPSITFGFHGGRLVRKGPGNTLHQSEYAVLLIELVKMRIDEVGILTDIAGSGGAPS